MGAVQLDAVEADALGVGGRLRERLDDVVQVLLGHGLAGDLGTLAGETGRPDGRGVGEGRLARLTHHADVPQLGHDRAARRVHRVRDLRPARELLLAVEARDAVALPGRLVADVGALGDDEADARGGTAGVVPDDVLARDTARRELPGHRCHHDPVRDVQAVQGDGAGQDLGCTGGGVGSHVRDSSERSVGHRADD